MNNVKTCQKQITGIPPLQNKRPRFVKLKRAFYFAALIPIAATIFGSCSGSYTDQAPNTTINVKAREALSGLLRKTRVQQNDVVLLSTPGNAGNMTISGVQKGTICYVAEIDLDKGVTFQVYSGENIAEFTKGAYGISNMNVLFSSEKNIGSYVTITTRNNRVITGRIIGVDYTHGMSLLVGGETVPCSSISSVQVNIGL